MNKRKIILLATALCMVAILVAGGTLAYFTDTDKADNVFVIGHVSIRQDEWQRELDENGDPIVGGAIETFDQNKNVFPAVLDKLGKEDITVDGYDFKIRSLKGNYIDKVVNVTNTGTEEAYIRTIFAIPSMNGYDDSADATENPLHWNYLDATDFNGVGWDWNGSNDAEATAQKQYAQDVEINGVKYDLYVATYNEAVANKATTSPSMVGFYLDDDVDYDEKGYFSMQNGQRIDLAEWLKPDPTTGKVTLKILVATEACQTEGFADAWEALDECFGAITAENNPWTTWNK